MTRERYLYDKELKQWRPDYEVLAKRYTAPEAFNFKVYQSGYNHCLGGYCGSKADERNLQAKIEGETGTKLEAIGDAKLTNHGTQRKYDVRDALQRLEGQRNG